LSARRDGTLTAVHVRIESSLGLGNGDLFGRVVAFSPGFIATVPPRGRPRLFMSHGTADSVLAINQCSRRVVPRLRQAGHDVMYQEFRGPHTLASETAQMAAPPGFRRAVPFSRVRLPRRRTMPCPLSRLGSS
jgi:hypothetical protein